jgi:hypothetical protein
MNDAALGERLRALRVPPPDTGFEQRLREALSKEAPGLRAPSPARRIGARRWSARAGLTLAVALGASAAAAAVGWVSWPPLGDSSDSPGSVPTASSEQERKRPAAPSSAEVDRAMPPERAAASAAPLAIVADPAAVSAPVTQPGAPSGLRSSQSQRAATGSPASAPRPERAARSTLAARPAKPEGAGVPAIVPFELPGVDLPGARAEVPTPGAERKKTTDRRAPRAQSKDVDRPLPKLEHGPPERAERGASELMRERGRTREPRGRENAERGLDRAREARERNAK